MPPKQSALIETDTLYAQLNNQALKILDASFHIPPSPRQADVEYEQGHIPGALFFDIEAISDPKSALPHMLPSPEAFEKHMQSLGIRSQDRIVIYDVHGIMSAPRAWWMFRYFGHEQVYVLNGGLPKWLAENRPMQSGLPELKKSSQLLKPEFQAKVQPQLLCTLDILQSAVTSSDGNMPLTQIIDMRAAARFNGAEPEPRAGLRSGHIPGSLNAPWGTWLNPDKTLLSPTDLEANCQRIGLDWKAHTVATCGSGITACVGALVLHELGNASCAVYDGAWAEWGSLASLPVAVSSSV